jgi:hypothetical protein
MASFTGVGTDPPSSAHTAVEIDLRSPALGTSCIAMAARRQMPRAPREVASHSSTPAGRGIDQALGAMP